MQFIFWTSIIIIIYVYIGYPILLAILNQVMNKPVKKDSTFTPSVSLIISAYNEEKNIRQKIINSLDQDYPEEKFQIIIVSDSSTDRTDEIINEYISERVILIRQSEREGKSFGLNSAMPLATGEIVVFSDANAIYKKDALKKLVRNFKDENVGYVTGEARYTEDIKDPASSCENRYWDYEIFLKKKESLIGSMVGGDGAIYAIRKQLFTPLEASDISDFLNPLQIVKKGWRGVYEPEAISYEEAAGNFSIEFQRKNRIISRSFKAVFKVVELLNPLKYGFFSLQLISHKILRWYIPLFLILIFVSSFFLGANQSFYRILFFIQLMLYGFSLLLYLLKPYYTFKRELIYFPYYFCTVNLASLIGIINAITGRVPATWKPHRSFDDNSLTLQNGARKNDSILILSILFSIIFLIITSIIYREVALFALWICLAIIGYVYFGYPIILATLSSINKKRILQQKTALTVTLLIPAHNEEVVIEEKIKNSLSLDYPRDRLKIVIASDGSVDRTNEIVNKYKEQGIELLAFSPRSGKMATLNRAMKTIDTEIVVFSDANVMYQNNAVQKLIRNFGDNAVGAVSGDVILINDNDSYGGGERLYYKYERFIQTKESELESIVGVDGAMYAIRRSLYIPPSNNIILDDFVISMNIASQGYRVIYEPEAVGFERSPGSVNEDFHRKTRIIAGGIQALKQREGLPKIHQKILLFEYISHKLLRWFIPIFAIILFLANLSLVQHSQFYTIIFILQAGFYLSAFVGSVISECNRITSVPFYFCMVNAAAIVGIYKGFLDKQKTMWQIVRR